MASGVRAGYKRAIFPYWSSLRFITCPASRLSSIRDSDGMTKPILSANFAPPGARAPVKASLSAIRWRSTRPMILAASLITVIYLSLAAIVIAVDPHNIYSWGAEPRIERGDTPRDLVIDWIDVAAKDPAYNTFLVGSSVTAMYTPEYMKGVLGPDAHVANLSYGGPRPRDRDLVLDRLVANPTIQHVILTFDWTYIQDPEVTNRSFPAFLYDSDITNDLRMVNFPTIRKAFDILGGNLSYSNPDDATYKTYVDKMYEGFQHPSEMTKIARLVERHRTEIGASSGRDCASFHAINDQLVPDVRALSDRGVKVDIMIPIASYAFYYVRRNDISPTLLDEQMIARRCLVNAVGDLPHVNIFAFDDDPAVAGDLANFREVGHVYDPAILRRFVTATTTGTGRLTRDNFPTHERAIRSAVENYRLTNSYLGRATATEPSENTRSNSSTS
ncbi:hypothetical protein [Qipengyuania qiaonensis]|uniref:TonB-dependent receptor n=1 Tax=Qipengyuania qiaonensis TaxID=2867240 RepID=A0ABS7J7S1_9SPHN|nr:hypothetical protein [Qipengyuania qiaonensis]MBX7483362.1 hypothetical protein [Qipengyuania qiaonensis]